MRAIKQVTFLLIDELLHIINWPPNIDGCRKIAEGFFRMGGMPKIGGCVDGTVVPINPPRLSGSAFKGKDNVKGIKVYRIIFYRFTYINIILITGTRCVRLKQQVLILKCEFSSPSS